jgi:membrane-bound ClpP family serine protease
MSMTLIIFLILLGIILFLIEFLLVPGITIAGIGGAILMIGGVIMAYHYHGTAAGNYTLIGTAVVSFITIYFVLKTKTWNRIMLKTNIEGKVNVVEKENPNVKVGDVGETVTRLNPMGRVLVNGEYFEGKSEDGFIDQQSKVEVINVLSNKIIVKLKRD